MALTLAYVENSSAACASVNWARAELGPALVVHDDVQACMVTAMLCTYWLLKYLHLFCTAATAAVHVSGASVHHAAAAAAAR
jgi:hypothetical protein